MVPDACHTSRVGKTGDSYLKLGGRLEPADGVVALGCIDWSFFLMKNYQDKQIPCNEPSQICQRRKSLQARQRRLSYYATNNARCEEPRGALRRYVN